MANIEKLVCTWNYGTGAPGYTTFFVSAAQAASFQPRLVTFWTAVAPYLATAFSVVVPPNGEVIDETTGKMVNVWSGPTQVTVTGTAAAAWASTSGALVRWDTGRFANGRKVRGRTFIVPIVSSAYSSGTISTTVANAINAAATTLWNAAPGVMVVWTRPKYDHSTNPPTLKTPGISYPVNSATTPTKVTYLSSRRD